MFVLLRKETRALAWPCSGGGSNFQLFQKVNSPTQFLHTTNLHLSLKRQFGSTRFIKDFTIFLGYLDLDISSRYTHFETN